MASRMFESPGRLQRALQEQEDALGDLPSLPGPAYSGMVDDSYDDSSSDLIPPFRDSLPSSEKLPITRSHSTPQQLSHSNVSRSARSTASTERFAASLRGSQASNGSRDRSLRDFSFDVSKIEQTPHDLRDLSALIVDDDKALDAVDFEVPVPAERDDASISDAMESISLTSSSRKTDEMNEEPVVSCW